MGNDSEESGAVDIVAIYSNDEAVRPIRPASATTSGFVACIRPNAVREYSDYAASNCSRVQ